MTETNPENLKTGRRYLWHLRNNGTGPFHNTKIDGTHVTVEYQPTGTTAVIDVTADPHTIIPARNSSMLRSEAAPLVIHISKGTTFDWNTFRVCHLRNKTFDDAVARFDHDGPGSVVSEPGTGMASFPDWATCARFCRETFGIGSFARDRFGGWVPADDWRAVTEGVPCTNRGCDRVVDRDGRCKMHANGAEKSAASTAAHKAALNESLAAGRRERHLREQCHETLDRIRPTLTELGIHPDTVTVPRTTDGRTGILLPAETVELLVQLAGRSV